MKHEIQLIYKKDPLSQSEASKSSIKDLFIQKVLASNYCQNFVKTIQRY